MVPRSLPGTDLRQLEDRGMSSEEFRVLLSFFHRQQSKNMFSPINSGMN